MISWSRIVGPRVTKIFALSLLVGIALFFVEIALATSIAAFLSVLGVVDRANIAAPAWMRVDNPFAVLSTVIAIGLIRAGLQWAQVYMQGATTDILRHDQRVRIVNWAFNAESVSSGKVVALFNDIAGGASQFMMSVQMLLLSSTLAAMLLGKLFLISPFLTIASVGTMFLLGMPALLLGRKVDVSATSLNIEAARINEGLLINIKNLILMQIYRTQDREEKSLRIRLEKYTERHLSYHAANGLNYAAPQVLGVLLICSVALLTRRAGTLPPGQILIYFYLFVRFVQNGAEAAKAANGARFSWPYAADLATWWKEHSSDLARLTRTTATPGPSQPIHSSIGWKLERVSYTYPGCTEPVIRDLDLNIRPGEALVIVGPSGSGKSTLLNLLLGRAVPVSGQIHALLDGVQLSLSGVQDSLLRRVGYVGAESFLVEGSIRENLLYGLSETPSDSDMIEALARAECQFVHDLPKGLEHRLTEQGQGLSAGQKQRISLARALLRKPLALFLDEATANLDHETESRLIRTLSSLKGQMTLIAVTHRQGLLEIANQQLRLPGP